MPRIPDPWAACPHEQAAREKPVLCDHCGEETYDPEEVSTGDLLCDDCAKVFHKTRNGGAK